MVYTSKLLVFVSVLGNEVVDVIPLAEIAVINVAAEETAKPNRRNSSLANLDADDDNESDPGLGEESQNTSPNSKSLELEIETDPGGYNSGRSYKVSVGQPDQNNLLYYR